MKEFGFQIDDVRWHLCSEIAQRFLALRDHPDELTRLIWSGKVETELYDMEERYLRSLQEDLDRALTDEAHLRQLFQEVRRSKLRRTRG